MLCRNGDIEIQVLDEKIRFLKLKVAEKKRQIKLWLKALPMKKDLDAHVVVLQIQVGGKTSPIYLYYSVFQNFSSMGV